MKYRYRNVKNGEIITTSNQVRGKNWEPAEDAATQSSAEKMSADDGGKIIPAAAVIPGEKQKETCRRGE